MEIRARAENILSSDSIIATPSKIEFVTRMIRMFEAICELPTGRYWLMHHRARPYISDWRKVLYSALTMELQHLDECEWGFSDIYACFVAEFKLDVDDPARTLMQECCNEFEHYAALAAAECGLLCESGDDPRTGASPSVVVSLEEDWSMRRDFEWCVPVADLHDYGGKINIELRQMRIFKGCYNLLRWDSRARDAAYQHSSFEMWSGIAPSLFLSYKSNGDRCDVFAKDTARIVEVSHDASYVRGSQKSERVVNDGTLAEKEFVDANELLDHVLGHALPNLGNGDVLLGDTIFVTDHFLRYKTNWPSLLLIMIGDTDTLHTVSAEAAGGFELVPEMWYNADIPRVVGILHAALPEGRYPARVFTLAGASKQAQAWIKSKFLKSGPFQSFCRRWELKPSAVLATADNNRKGMPVTSTGKRAREMS